MSTTPPKETPAQTLARQIVERLVSERLVTPEAGAKLLPKLADGSLRAEDWRLPIEIGVKEELL